MMKEKTVYVSKTMLQELDPYSYEPICRPKSHLLAAEQYGTNNSSLCVIVRN